MEVFTRKSSCADHWTVWGSLRNSNVPGLKQTSTNAPLSLPTTVSISFLSRYPYPGCFRHFTSSTVCGGPVGTSHLSSVFPFCAWTGLSVHTIQIFTGTVYLESFVHIDDAGSVQPREKNKTQTRA